MITRSGAWTSVAAGCAKCFIVWILFISFLACPAGASSGTEGASFLEIPVGARPVGLGSAYSALATDAYAPTWNPAGLGFVTMPEVAGTHLNYVENTAFEYLSYVQPIGEGRAVGAAIQYFRPGTITGLDNNANPTGDVSGYYAAYSLAYGQRLGEDFSVGLTGKVISAKIDDVTASAYAGDIGTYYKPTKRLALAAVLANAGTTLKFLNQPDNLPFQARAGGAFHATDDLTIAAEGVYQRSGPASFHTGIEWPSEEDRGFSVRTGYSTDRTQELSALSGFSMGAAIPLGNEEFSFAWIPLSDFGSAYYFSLVLHFGKWRRDQNSQVLHPADDSEDGTFMNKMFSGE